MLLFVPKPDSYEALAKAMTLAYTSRPADKQDERAEKLKEALGSAPSRAV